MTVHFEFTLAITISIMVSRSQAYKFEQLNPFNSNNRISPSHSHRSIEKIGSGRHELFFNMSLPKFKTSAGQSNFKSRFPFAAYCENVTIELWAT